MDTFAREAVLSNRSSFFCFFFKKEFVSLRLMGFSTGKQTETCHKGDFLYIYGSKGGKFTKCIHSKTESKIYR